MSYDDLMVIFQEQLDTKVDNLYFALNDNIVWTPKDSMAELSAILDCYTFRGMSGVIPEFKYKCPKISSSVVA